jgi:hypothetical protein
MYIQLYATLARDWTSDESSEQVKVKSCDWGFSRTGVPYRVLVHHYAEGSVVYVDGTV